MKKLVLLFFLAACAITSRGQAYTPLDLDTSCYWIQRYNYYSGVPFGPISVQGEVIQYVAGDTVIQGNTYYKINGYSTTTKPFGVNSNLNHEHYFYNCYNPVAYIRDDSINKRILGTSPVAPFSELVLLDFNLNVGDSMSHSGTNAAMVNIDSIIVKNYYGVLRRTLYGASIQAVHQGYNRIEGIGANYNFPDVRNGEWGVPVFELNAFIKGGNILYKHPNFPVDSCYRKPRANPICWPLSVSNTEQEEIQIHYSKNQLRLDNVSNKTTIRLINLTGVVVFVEKDILGLYQKEFNGLPVGVYILSVQSEKSVQNKKILIQ